jgi:hypothetical protein
VQRGHALDVDDPPTGERDGLVDVGSRSQKVADLIEGAAEAMSRGSMADCGRHGGLWRCRRIDSRFDSDSLSIADTLDQSSPPTVCHAPVTIAAQVLNRMLDLGCPNSVRVA